ncbi:primosomal protein N' family DNA-binding protein [Rickettsiella massiliensis]|uniref:primosomal protein N' family DNA-binding protein n=1 Tax=Rickettsiella massiliensis TaxID=676517 RepID=UPI00029A6DB4|nr:hypothetical protein [Rickettsiella massiliensis]
MTPILEIVLPVPLNQSFDYLAPEHVPISALKKGLRVLVPFGQREKVGFIVGIRQSSCLPVTQLKQVITLLDEEVLLPDQLIRLLDWTHRYYHHPLGEVFAHAFPTLLRKVPKKNSDPAFKKSGMFNVLALELDHPFSSKTYFKYRAACGSGNHYPIFRHI